MVDSTYGVSGLGTVWGTLLMLVEDGDSTYVGRKWGSVYWTLLMWVECGELCGRLYLCG